MAKVDKSKIPQRSKENHTIQQRRGSIKGKLKGALRKKIKIKFQYKVQVLKLFNEFIIREIKDMQNYSNIFVSGNYQDEVLIPVKSEENLQFLFNLKIHKREIQKYT